jgi:hypothetical protein
MRDSNVSVLTRDAFKRLFFKVSITRRTASHAERDLPLPAPGEGAILGPTTTPNPGNVGLITHTHRLAPAGSEPFSRGETEYKSRICMSKEARVDPTLR